MTELEKLTTELADESFTLGCSHMKLIIANKLHALGLLTEAIGILRMPNPKRTDLLPPTALPS